MEAGHDKVDEDTRLDDLVLIIEVDPGPEFRIAEVGGRPLASGAVSLDTAAGSALGPGLATSESTMRHLRAAWETGRPQHYVADRGNARYDAYVSPLEGPGGRDRLVLHVVGRQDRAERRRHIVNAAIVDALPGSVALIDPEGVIRAVNAGWVRFGLERSHDGLLADAGTNYLDVTDRADDASARAAAEAIRAVLAGTADHAATDYPTEDASDSERYTMRVAPVDIDDERWAVISHEDVSALRHALDRWHATFSSAAVPTIIVNRRGEIVDGNGAFAELVGTDLPSTIGRSTTDFIHPDSQPEVRRRVRRAGEGRAVLTPNEVKLLRPDGTTVIAMMHPSAVLPGQVPGAVVQLIDLTQQRRAEARLALQRELLELVAAGTPFAEVATAVAINIGRAIDGATGAVVLAGSDTFTAPGTPIGWSPDGESWRVPVDQSRPALGAVVIASSSARRGQDDEDAAAMLASIVRLALQRDESVTHLGGLPTNEQLGETIAWLGRSRATVAMFVVGPVDFDALLAEQGWRGAEAALADIGATVRAAVPGASMIARRGQQILLLVETTSQEDAVEIGTQLAKRADIAVGIATAPSEGASAETMLDQAEEALAAARLRSDRVARFGASMRERTGADQAADDLRRGLAADEVTVHYQPIVDLRTGTPVGLEALVRWMHPTRGFVPPPELIDLAEVSGLIDEVGALVLLTACRDLAGWRRDGVGAANLTVAVNISAIQLDDPNLVSVVQHALTETGLDPGALVVEITESVVVTDVDQVAAALAELRALGVGVAIDDFGTGYSSLLYLKRFPADVLKVDRSFVQGLGVHEGDTAIVEAVVELGHRLGLAVVAEGVESAGQLTELRRLRCDQAQGYLLQVPVPAAEIGRFLDTGAVDLGPEPAVVPATELDVDELLSLVTHELSTPLSVIGGHAELLADLMRSDDDSPSAVIDALERNIRNLDDLLRSLTGLSHALGTPAQTMTVELDAFVDQTTHDLGPLLAQHDVRLTLAPERVQTDVEPVALRQILTNVLSNAVKFTDPGTVIDISVRSGDDHEVVIADHGRGIPQDREGELFGRFSRLGNEARGLGLGLHLSRELARRNGGDLVHEPTPGGGATFVLRIPR